MEYFAISMDGAHVGNVRPILKIEDLHYPEVGVVEAESTSDARHFALRCPGCPRCGPSEKGNPPYIGGAHWVR